MRGFVPQIAVNRVKEKFYSFLPTVSSSDVIILMAGLGALVLGVVVDVFVIRLVCLLIVLSSAVLMAAVLHLRKTESPPISDGMKPHDRSQFQIGGMKKLLFDDFQSNVDGKYPLDEVQPYAPMSKEFSEPPSVSGSKPMPVAAPAFAAFGSAEPQHLPREFHISDFFDIGSEIYKGDAEPRAEFDFLLVKVLAVVKEVLFAHTVAFFWANREKQQMVLEARLTDSADFMTSRRFAIGHDLVSKVALTGQPELLTEVNPRSERELLPYYDVPASIKSYIGVPVYFARTASATGDEHPVGVIVIDNKAADEFGEETLALMGQFTKLVSALIKSYTDKYDLLLDAELLRSIRRLQERIRNDISQATIVQALAEETSKLINWDFLSIVLFDEAKRAWVAKKTTNRSSHPYIAPEQVVEFPESIVGQTIRNNVHSLVDDLDAMMPPRYHSGEKIETKGSFISVPISSLNKCYGAINLESKEKYNFSRRDIDMLYRLADNTASALEILYLNEVINEYVIIDGVTGAYSKKYFLQKLGEELQRADETGCDLSMMFVSVDRAQEIVERYGQEGLDRVVGTLSKAVRASVRAYDIIGRYESNRFSILLIDTASSDAYLWAEKIRKNVAGMVINLGGKTFSVTISIGVCGTVEGMRKEELVGNTTAVLSRATDAGGNSVRVF